MFARGSRSLDAWGDEKRKTATPHVENEDAEEDTPTSTFLDVLITILGFIVKIAIEILT